MKLSSKLKKLFRRKSVERGELLERLQSMIRETKERGRSYYGYLCNKGTCFKSGVG